MDKSEKESLACCPSFRKAGIGDGDDGFAVSAVFGDSPPQISAATRRGGDYPSGAEGDDDDDSSDDFEFPFVLGGDESGPAITADEIFVDGRLRPSYPVFGRKLIPDEKLPPTFCRKLALKEDPPPPTASEEQEPEAAPVRLPLRQLLCKERNSSVGSTSSSSSSSSLAAAAAELQGIPKESYCLWTPGLAPSSSPAQCRKSGSTGSRLQWRRLSELVVRRSHSDGNAKFLFLAAAGQEEKEKADASPSGRTPEAKGEGKATKKGKGRAGKVTEMDAVTARRVFYRKAAQGGGGAAAFGRLTYLPYRQDLFALMGNAKGLTRTHH